MLQFIRDRATGWVAWAIIILICIPFALWGIYDYLSPNPTVAVATVNGTEITAQQFQAAHRRGIARLRSALGATFDLARFDEGGLREQTLQNEIQQELLIQASRAAGLVVGDVQLAAAIHAQTPFQQDGVFSQARYENFLRNQGYSPAGFEYDLRRSLLTEQLQSGIAGSSITTDREKAELIRLRAQTRTFRELKLPVASQQESDVPPAEIEAYYEAHRDELVTPETVTVEYVSISMDDLAAEIQPSEDDLRVAYEAAKSNYSVPASRKASHILIRLEQDATESAVAEASARADALSERLGRGEDFAELAREFSEDPGSAGRGGDLGYFERGVMDKNFEDAVFSMQVGAVSEPVRSSFGFHIIKLTDLKEGGTKPFDEVRDQVLNDFQRSQAEQIYFEHVERLANIAFEFPDTLSVAAEELGLEIQQAGPFDRTGDPTNLIAGDPRFIEAAFSQEVLEEGNNSDVIELPDSRVVSIRRIAHEPSRPKSLEEARPQIEEIVRAERARDRVRERGEESLERLRAGESESAVAESVGAEWVEHEALRRDARATEPAVMSRVFAMPRPVDGKVQYAGVEIRSGDFAIVALTEVVDGDPSKMSETELESIEAELARDYGGMAFDAYLQAVREEADIIINQEAL